MSKEETTGLELLRKPFEPHQISKLPKQSKWMTEAKDEYKNCDICGGFHHPKAVHLDYVGHAALTDRLLDCDPNWSWKPVSFNPQTGSPYIDNAGGLWIELTVCGVTRYGYGHPDGKKGGDAIKESIGDALRNAAMRFGAALDLWHKGDLHAIEAEEEKPEVKADKKADAPKPKLEIKPLSGEEFLMLQNGLKNAQSLDELKGVWVKAHSAKARMTDKQYETLEKAKNKKKTELENKEMDGSNE